MTITFKQFTQLVDLSDEEFIQLEEGLSDLPGFGWLKGKDNSAKLAKIAAERAKLQKLKTARSKELDAQFAKIKAGIESGNKQKPRVASNDDPDDFDAFSAALTADDRRIHARIDKSNANLEHRRRNLANESAQDAQLGWFVVSPHGRALAGPFATKTRAHHEAAARSAMVSDDIKIAVKYGKEQGFDFIPLPEPAAC